MPETEPKRNTLRYQSIEFVMNGKEWKAMEYLSWTSANHCVQEIPKEVCRNDTSQDVVSGSRGPPVAKDLKSKIDCTSSKHSGFKNDRGLKERTANVLERHPPPRSESLDHKVDLQLKPTTGNGFIPAWRRKSLDEIKRLRRQREGKSSESACKPEVCRTPADLFLWRQFLKNPA